VLRSAAEFWLIGTIGRPPVRAHNVRNLIAAPVREHSRKPDTLHGKMERLYGGPCCELFAREAHEGWSVWGNEVGRFDADAPAAASPPRIAEPQLLLPLSAAEVSPLQEDLLARIET
jgi:N6-adenosine-specific RNA methylase IME4